MAAGLGFKTFTTGEVLTAADTNGYLMQGVLVFASSAARAAAITSPQEGQYSYLKDTNSTEYYDGAAWIAAPIGDITGVTAGTGISGGGTSGTVTITNSMATEIAAKGDLIVGTGAATFDNLTVGANGTTLVADSTAATGLKWATPATAASGLTFIQRSTFSGVANTGTTFDGVFSTTYDSYVIVLENCTAATGTDDPIFQFRYSGTTEASSNYFYSRSYQPWNASPTYAGSNSDTKFVLEHEMGNLNGTLFINNMGNQRPNLYGNMVNYLYQYFLTFGGNLYQQRAYTGFLWSSSSSNVSGTITVYGMAKS